MKKGKNNQSVRVILGIIIIVLLSSCGAPTPPTELAPDGELVQKAIALQLRQTQQLLSQQLSASTPELEISKINVKKLEPFYISNLAAYHLQGTYNLKLKLPRQEITQKNNRFDIYLQRQAEGKTWRLLRRDATSNRQPQWSSYLIR